MKHYWKYGDYVDRAAERLSIKLVEQRRKIEKIEELNKEAEPHKKIVDAFNLVDQLTNQNLTNLQRQSEMEGFKQDKRNDRDANLSIKNYNKLIKEYETSFFGKMFSEDPQAQDQKLIVKGVLNINEKEIIPTK